MLTKQEMKLVSTVRWDCNGDPMMYPNSEVSKRLRRRGRMTRKEIASLEAKSSNVADVIYIIEQLETMAPSGSIVDVEMQMDGDVGAASLYEETLTDGSRVYNIQLR